MAPGDSTTHAATTECPTCALFSRSPMGPVGAAELEHLLGADYFELFGLARGFDIDEAALEQRYLAISRNVHPDRFATRDEASQAFALRASAAVNAAYQTLREAPRRAEYLLTTAGGATAEQDKRTPPRLLADVMMMREDIEEAKSSGDAAALAPLKERVERQKRDGLRRITGLCAKLPGDAKTKDALRLELNALKYYDNLLAQLN